MKRISLITVLVFVALLIGITAVPIIAEENATPDEVVVKVKEASAFLIEEGEAGLATFNDPEGSWVWKDTYVFVYDCDTGVCVGNITPGLVGKKIEDIKDVNGKTTGLDICDASKKPNGWWIEYIWRNPKTEELMPKLSFVYKAPGAKYTVCAGIYSPEGLTAADLNANIEE